MLSQLGFMVKICNDGHDAVQLMSKDTSISLVLMDLTVSLSTYQLGSG
jgi:CheY-like chemotaxis protein